MLMTIWASLAVLSVAEHIWFHGALLVVKKGIYSFGNFTRDANRQLVADICVSTKVGTKIYINSK